MNQQTTETDGRRLLAEVSKWAHANGWTNGEWRGYMNATYWHEATVMVRPHECGFDVFRTDQGGPITGRPDEYPATSVREAVDLLVALRILPDRFSSAFEAGVDSCRPTIRRLIHGLVFGSASEFVRLREQVAPSVSVRSGDVQQAEAVAPTVTCEYNSAPHSANDTCANALELPVPEKVADAWDALDEAVRRALPTQQAGE